MHIRLHIRVDLTEMQAISGKETKGPSQWEGPF